MSIPGPEVPCIFPRLWLCGWRPVSRLRVSGEGAGPGSAPHPAASFPSRAVTSPQQGEGVRHLLNHFTINGSFAGENIPPSITRSDLSNDRPGRVWCRLPRGHSAVPVGSAGAASRARVYFRTGTLGARARARSFCPWDPGLGVAMTGGSQGGCSCSPLAAPRVVCTHVKRLGVCFGCVQHSWGLRLLLPAPAGGCWPGAGAPRGPDGATAGAIPSCHRLRELVR